ncbi:MAG: tetratricopeptide repeat protein [Ignavibacteriales bacterium]|nr:tetratricopeptide repeat protein [Ignavibacteriales bacterium]
MQVLQNFEKQHTDALQLAVHLHQLYPNNVIFHKYVGRCYAAVGNWTEMRGTFLDIMHHVREKRLGYDTTVEREANYYLGLHEMTFGRHTDALHYFYRADELSRSLDRAEISGFMVMTNLRIGMIYDLQGKRDLAITQYKKVLDMKDFQDAHKQAEQYLKTPYSKS